MIARIVVVVLLSVAAGAIFQVDATCGDYMVDAFEGCDFGDTQSGDGCSNTCQTEFGYVLFYFRCLSFILCVYFIYSFV